MCERIINACVSLAAEKIELVNFKFKITGKSGSEDGYGSHINFVQLIGTDKNGKEQIVELAVKSSKNWDRLQHVMESIFEKEIYIYSQVKPAFELLQNDYAIPNIINFMPECYGTVSDLNEYALVFENLKVQEFSMMELGKRWPWDLTCLALTAYGKWHALSFALKTLKPDVFQSMTKNNVNMMSKVGIEMKFFNNLVREYLKDEDNFIKRGFNLNVPNFISYSKEDVMYALTDMFYDKDSVDKSVILHGDCWSNNYLVKLQKNTQLDIRIMDWQCSGLASPVFDLSHHMFSTANFKEHSNINDYLKVYYESFCNTMTLFKCNPEAVFSYQELLNHWRKFSKFGFFIGCYAVKFCCPKKEKFELDPGKLNNDDDLESLHNIYLANEDDYYEKAKELFLFYYNNIMNN